ncbi:MAG: ATP-binding protein [Desulfomonilaceae bacterium]
MRSLVITLRHKVILGMAAVFLFMGATIVGCYYSMYSLEDKIGYLEEISKVEEAALEMRRFEKNYFLYGDDQSLKTTLYHLGRINSLLDKNLSKIEELITPQQVKELKNSLTNYGKLLTQFSNNTAKGQITTSTETRVYYENELRKTGSSIVQMAENLAKRKRQSIRATISDTLKLLLFGLLVAGFGFGAIGSFLLAKVLGSLKLLEKSAEKIAKGEFEPIEELPSEKEIREIFMSFNGMALRLREREEQLVQSKKLASLGTMLAGVAHEINNPLSNISSSCEILLEELDEGDLEFQRSLLKKVLDQVEKARTIVLNLLEFSRTKEFRLENLSLEMIINKTLGLIQGQKPCGVKIITNIDPKIRIMADKQRIEQAFMNLVSNAFQAIESEGEVRIRAFSSNDGRVKIRIRDTGKGISEENVTRIFDPFFTTKDVGKGTGLGLFITHDIIRRHKGTIQVESSPGKGTVFSISLPTAESYDALSSTHSHN